ncbi:hypothetical protein TNCV_4685091 [Trichonephila clavipes]|nr:hypothetical protein TNCV_4685091 [Trichonephila clavipes]
MAHLSILLRGLPEYVKEGNLNIKGETFIDPLERPEDPRGYVDYRLRTAAIEHCLMWQSKEYHTEGISLGKRTDLCFRDINRNTNTVPAFPPQCGGVRYATGHYLMLNSGQLWKTTVEDIQLGAQDDRFIDRLQFYLYFCPKF